MALRTTWPADTPRRVRLLFFVFEASRFTRGHPYCGVAMLGGITNPIHSSFLMCLLATVCGADVGAQYSLQDAEVRRDMTRVLAGARCMAQVRLGKEPSGSGTS